MKIVLRIYGSDELLQNVCKYFVCSSAIKRNKMFNDRISLFAYTKIIQSCLIVLSRPKSNVLSTTIIGVYFFTNFCAMLIRLTSNKLQNLLKKHTPTSPLGHEATVIPMKITRHAAYTRKQKI